MKQILSFFLGFALGAMAVYLIVENRKAREERAEELALEYVDSIINWAFDKAEEIEAEEMEPEVYEAEEASYFRMFDKPGDCVDGSYFRVEEVLDEHYAIAREQEYYASSNLYLNKDLYVLFYSEEENKFYDDLIIKIPKGKCARQIGLYDWKEDIFSSKTIPIVRIMK